MSSFDVRPKSLKRISNKEEYVARRILSIAESVDTIAGRLSMNSASTKQVQNALRIQSENLRELREKTHIFSDTLEEIAQLYEKTEHQLAGAGGSIENVRNTAESIRRQVEEIISRSTILNILKGIRRNVNKYCGDPVNMATGNFTWARSYLRSNGNPILQFTLSYNSVQPADSALGSGWTHNYSCEITRDEEGKIQIQMGDGHIALFRESNSGKYYSADGRDYLSNTEKGFCYTDPEGTKWQFDERDRLISMTERFSQSVNLEYRENDRLDSVIRSDGYSYHFIYDEYGKIFSVEDCAGRSISLGHEEGALTSLTDENGNTIRIGYTEAGYLESMADNEGHIKLFNIYDDEGRVITQKLPDNTQVSFTYDDENNTVTYTDTDGSVTIYNHDDMFRSTGTDNGEGREQYTYNENGQRDSFRDRNGNLTRYKYDEKGNLTARLRPENIREEWDYNSRGMTTSVKLNGYELTHMQYNAQGYMVSQKDDLGNETRIAYDDIGRQREIQKPDGSRIHIDYDGNGRVQSIDDPVSGCTKYEYDTVGNVSAVTDALGARTEFLYDARGNLIGDINAEGNESAYFYNESGRVTEYKGYGGERQTFRFNDSGRITEMTDPDGRNTLFHYDQVQRLASVTDGSGGITQYEYDNHRRVSRVILPDGNSIGYTYDANGNVANVVYPDGSSEHMTYDGLGRMVHLLTSDNREEEYRYNAQGKVIHWSDSTGREISATYDKGGRFVRGVDIRGIVTSRSYDTLGRIAMETIGGKTYQYKYNPGGQIAQKTFPDGTVECFKYDAVGNMTERRMKDGRNIYYRYDSMRRVIETGTDRGRQWTFEYDANGNILSRTDGRGARTSYTYSPAGMLLSVTDPAGCRVEYEYDGMRRMTQMKKYALPKLNKSDELAQPEAELKERVTRYKYDVMGRIIETADPIGNIETAEYDSIGRLCQRRYADGRVLQFSYNAEGLPELIKGSDGTEIIMRYDALRQLYEIMSKAGTMQIRHNIAGNVESFTDEEGRTVRYCYGKNSERTSIEYPDGSEVNYSYDEAQRLRLLQIGSNSIRYEYGQNGMLSRKVCSGGQSTEYVYNRMGQLTEMTNRDSERILDEMHYAYDVMGARTRMEQNRHNMSDVSGVFSYTYDTAGRLCNVSKDGKMLRAYHYDPFGNRTEMMENGSVTLYEYNAADQLVRKASADGEVKYRYDLRGNLAQIDGDGRNTVYYEYDIFNHLVSKCTDRQMTAYTYNGLGFQNSEVISEGEAVISGVSDVVDITADSRNLLMRTNNGVTSQYIWDTAAAALRTESGTGFMLTDDQGSILQFTGISGLAAQSYSYDEYGKMQKAAGAENWSQPFGYTGYLRTQDSDFWNANARIYDSTSGRFTSKDPAAGTRDFVPGLNPYIYCWNRPLDYVDRNGRWPSWSDIKEGITNKYNEVSEWVSNKYEKAEAWAEEKGREVYEWGAREKRRWDEALHIPTKEEHYNRNSYMGDIPRTQQEAEEAGWDSSVAANYHQYSGDGHVKYVSPDGRSEAIYDADGNLITDSIDAGTYNYYPSSEGSGDTNWLRRNIGHFFNDMVPYYLYGNQPEDAGETNFWERLIGPGLYKWRKQLESSFKSVVCIMA